ncbi:MAG: SBBP repeat-containing protein [Bryobacteraceae bacterium]
MAGHKSTNLFIIFLAFFAAQGVLANSIRTKQQLLPNPSKLELRFEPNEGQTDEQVDFLAHAAGYNVFLSRGEAVLTFWPSAMTVRLKPSGANILTAPEPLEKLTGASNYFVGSSPERWQTGIPNFRKVRYRDVYAGVDLIYHGNAMQLEYDFVVHPGADPGRILLEIQGASKPEVNRQGDVVIGSTAGDVRWHAPVAYQEIDGIRRIIPCAYVRKDEKRFSFEISRYDRAKPLIIDPVLEYSTYLGGSGFDKGSAIAVDRHGSAYVTGTATSADFPTQNTSHRERKSPFGTSFVTKFDRLGRLVYSTYLGGSGSPDQLGDASRGIAVDCNGNAYITGYAVSPNFPTKNAFQSKLLSATGAAFVTELNADGNALVYSTYLSGSNGAYGNSIAVDAQRHAYITGGTSSVDFPITRGAFQETFKSQSSTIFVTKFASDGRSLLYSTYLGGSGYDQGSGIAVDAHGEVYVTGSTFSTDFPMKHAFQNRLKSAAHGADNAFVAKLDPGGTALVYSTYLGGSAGDQGNSIAVDAHGGAYVTGYTSSADFPTKHAFQNRLRGYTNAFVTKMEADGELGYSTYLGGSVNGFPGDYGSSIAVDGEANAYVTGSTASVDFPVQNAFQATLRSTSGNAFITKLSADCELVYSSYLGGRGIGGDEGSGIAVDAHGYAYVTGRTASTDFPTRNAFQKTNKSMGDPIDPTYMANGFVARIGVGKRTQQCRPE